MTSHPQRYLIGHARVRTKIFLNMVPTALVTRPPVFHYRYNYVLIYRYRTVLCVIERSPEGRVTNAVGTIFRKIFVGTRTRPIK